MRESPGPHPKWKVDQLPDGTFRWTTPASPRYRRPRRGGRQRGEPHRRAQARMACALLRAAEAAAFGGETEEGDGPAEGFPDGVTGELALVSAVSRQFPPVGPARGRCGCGLGHRPPGPGGDAGSGRAGTEIQRL